MTQPERRPERPRLHRQRRAHADRQVRRRARGRSRPTSSVASRSAPPSSAPGSTRRRPPIDEVLMGQVLQAGAGQAPGAPGAPQGRPPRHDAAPRPSTGSAAPGLKAIMLAAAEIRAGDAEVVVAGGMESMNGARTCSRGALRLPARQRRARSTRPSTTACGARSRTATWAPTPSASRSRTHVSREDQDAFALASHQKAIAAIDAGRFDAEMAPVTVRDAKGRETVVDRDEGPRRDSTLEALARLKPVFACPTARTAATPRTARSPPATRRASPTAPPRRSSPASGRSSGSA